MGRDPAEPSLFQGIVGKVLRRKSAEQPAPSNTPPAMLDRLHSGESPDYCLYLRPPAGGRVVKNSPLVVDVEELLIKAFDPLVVVTLDESGKGDAGLPDEAFLTLANRARVLCVVPVADARYVQRLRILKTVGPIRRCIFVMPEQGTLGSLDWSATWPAAREAFVKIGIDLSGYTAGGWLFRIDREGKAVTFRPIVNPNPEKIARALESICVEME
jgi:hypothetical protein